MFDSDDYFTIDEVTEMELAADTKSSNEEVFPFPYPFKTKTAKGESYHVYQNNEELRDWLNSGLAEGALRFPVDRWGCGGPGEVVSGKEAYLVCDVLVGALRSVLTTGNSTRAMEPAKAWSLLRTLTTIERDSVRRHGEAKHKGIRGHALSDSSVDFQVKSLRAAGAALWELKARGLRFKEDAQESSTEGKEMTVWSSPNEDGEVFPLRVVKWSEVMTEDAKLREAWEDAMPAAVREGPRTDRATGLRNLDAEAGDLKRLAVAVSKMTKKQIEEATKMKMGADKGARASHKANRKAAERPYSTPVWLDGYHREMRSMGRTEAAEVWRNQWL